MQLLTRNFFLLTLLAISLFVSFYHFRFTFLSDEELCICIKKFQSLEKLEKNLGKAYDVYTKFPPQMGESLFDDNTMADELIHVRAYLVASFSIRFAVVRYDVITHEIVDCVIINT